MKTIEELEAAITWKGMTLPDNPMFFCMDGLPRAYMEIPVPISPYPELIARYVYGVLKWTQPLGKPKEALIERAYRTFQSIRSEAAAPPDDVAILFWRRRLGFFEDREINQLVLSCRLAIPGLELYKWLDSGGDSDRCLVAPLAPTES